uniref:Gibberellin biosynthesis-related protein KAO1 n=1 Tax=Salvia miltiorrhiza TaxID=226208 RepID=A0A0U2UAR1_SALMI|nr:gibberellin biosynthesis-related protein KAO1 [Salvia miltiorrhiza]
MMGWGLWVVGCCFVLIVRWVLRRVTGWCYERNLGERRYELPPGDLGWPFIGNMWSFLRAFKCSRPESFISSFVDRRYGHGGMYKVHMFGNPSIIVTTAEACQKVLTDDEAFKPGWPSSTMNLIGKNSFVAISDEEHRWLRKLTAAPVNGHEVLSLYMKYIEDNVIVALERWAGMGKMEFLTELRKLTFRIIMYIFLSSESEQVMEVMEREYTMLNYGVRAMAINIPGFAYHSALKARKRLVAVLQSIVTARREWRTKNPVGSKKDMMDALMDAQDDKGRSLKDEEIIDVLVMYLNAGHESSGHITMWATLFLQNHPDVLQRAKSGYTIPKGWKVLVWFRGVHFDPETYPDPKKFDPSRWDGFTPKAGNFLPFGGGSRLCPGNDRAKIEISIFLHHFVLNYELKRHNPASPLMYLPHTRPKDNCLGTITRRSAHK